MKLSFTKMHGAGNDFVVFDATRAPLHLQAEQLRRIADRHFGVGCDQILLVEPSRTPDARFRYRIFNADGGEVEQCGNGARCFARYVRDAGLVDYDEVRVETLAGVITLRLQADGQVSVDMGRPEFEPARVPFDAPARADVYRLELDAGAIEISAVSMGNPHAVQFVADVDAAPVAELGPRVESHPRFPQRVNAGFAQRIDRHTLRLRVYERGAGETLACGTGACAAAVVGILRGLLDSPVAVQTRGGTLTIAWAGEGEAVTMTGPAVRVFEGSIEV
ncbi:MAG: diaminopimelate epimerase [Pseudomonadota bacterium]